MKTIRLVSCLTEAGADSFKGTHLGADCYDLLVAGEDVDVLKPDGSPLLKYRHNAIPLPLCADAYHVLKGVKASITNRGTAVGTDIATKQGDAPKRHRKKDGTYSNTHYAGGRVQNALPGASSGIIGAFDRYIRIPYCRLTAFNLDKPAQFARCEPYVRAVDAQFREHMPDRYAVQQAMVNETAVDWVIKGTAFTAITVNQNWQTAVHKDAGDLREGFGVMSVLEGGHYEGCYLCFPRYRVAVDMRTGGVCMADVHEWHGNTPLVGVPGQYKRISCVFYYRRAVVRCGDAGYELDKAKSRKPGDPLYSADELARERETLALMGLVPYGD